MTYNKEACLRHIAKVTGGILKGNIDVSSQGECTAIWKRWVLYSGDSCFPVPGQGQGTAIHAYSSTPKDKLWDKSTKYGRNRWLLTAYLHKRARLKLLKYDYPILKLVAPISFGYL